MAIMKTFHKKRLGQPFHECNNETSVQNTYDNWIGISAKSLKIQKKTHKAYVIFELVSH